MSEDGDILAGLFGLREAPVGAAEVLVAFAVGLVIAGLIGMAVSLFRVRARAQTWADRIAGAQALPDGEQSLALAVLLREMTDKAAPGQTRWTERAADRFGFEPEEVEALTNALYQPGNGVTDRLVVMATRAARAVGT